MMPEVIVPATTKNGEGKRIYDRHHACYFCGELQSKIGRHLEMKHRAEDSVKDLKELDKIKDKKERDFILDKIRLLGDFYHNVKILKNGGELLVCRRPGPGTKIPASMYGPCKYCYGFYHKEELWRHIKRCLYNVDSTDDLPESFRKVQEEAEILLYGQKDPSHLELEEYVVKRMRKDDITNVATKDFLIMKYGSFLMQGKGSKKANLISNNMRLMARLLITLRTNCNMEDANLADFLKPINFDKIVQSTKQMAGYSQKNDDGEFLPSFKTPSLPLKIGFALSSVFMLLKGIGLREKNDDMIEDATNLSQLYSSEWSTHVSSASLRTIADNNFNKKEYLPVTSDLLKIKQHCVERMALLSETVAAQSGDQKDFRELAEIIITRLTIFNKRRGNEVSSILLKRFSNRHEHAKALHDDVLKSLSPLEQKLMERLDLVHVRGKCGKQVPVLLDESSVKAIDVLVAARSLVGIPQSNLYLFPAPTKQSKNSLRGYQCMNKVIERVTGLEFPESIKSTKLRKYVATVTQISSLTDTEMEWLCRHMGHTPEVHKQYYRLQDSAIELSKVSRLLIAVDSGKGASIKGKTLEDIKEDDIPDIELEVDDNENENEKENEPPKSAESIKRKRKPWSSKEIQIVNEQFQDNFKTGKLPKKAECEKVAKELDGRTWSNVKDFIRNKIKKSSSA